MVVKLNKIIKNKIILFIIITVSLLTILATLSYKTIMQNHSNTKNELNNKNLSTLIYKIEAKMNITNKIAINYSSDDDLFDYLENKQNNYVNKNFREGTYTLEDLDMSFLIIINMKNKVYFSTFTKEIEKENITEFKQYIINYFENTEKTNTIIFFNKTYYTLSKRKVYNSSYEGPSNGFIYVGSKINKADMNEFKKDFIEFKIIEKKTSDIQNNYTKNKDTFKITVEHLENNGYNNLELFDSNSQLVFVIKTKSDFKVMGNAKVTIQITFTLLLIVFLIILIFLTYRYKKNIYKQNDLLEDRIEARTNTIQGEMDKLKRTNLKLYDIAHTDFLTKSMNRRNFFIHAQNIFTEAVKENKNIIVVMIDIDNFKTFNDKYGHDIGDRVLVKFAQCIKDNIKEDTIFGRLGGEEFALLISNCTLEEAIIESEFLKEKVEHLDIKVDQNITASFGVSDRNNCHNIDEMLQKSDRLLYNAKASGRNQVRSRLDT
jgi:diguanylate cyclase (GGDEF)-like protein